MPGWSREPRAQGFNLDCGFAAAEASTVPIVRPSQRSCNTGNQSFQVAYGGDSPPVCPVGLTPPTDTGGATICQLRVRRKAGRTPLADVLGRWRLAVPAVRQSPHHGLGKTPPAAEGRRQARCGTCAQSWGCVSLRKQRSVLTAEVAR